MENNNQNQEVIFLTDTSPIISAILIKYGLEETSDEALEKLKKGERFHGEIILNIIEEIALGKISVKDLSSSLEKDLKVSGQIAKKMAKDVETKLLGLARKVPVEKEVVTPERPAPIILESPLVVEKPPIAEKPEKPVIKPKKTIEPEKSSLKEPDVYRELIE